MKCKGVVDSRKVAFVQSELLIRTIDSDIDIIIDIGCLRSEREWRQGLTLLRTPAASARDWKKYLYLGC